MSTVVEELSVTAENEALEPIGLSDYRTVLLRNTLLFLRERSPFYRERLADLDPDLDLEHGDVRTVLRALPPLAHEEWARARADMRTGPLDGVTLGYTSGTTGSPAPHFTTQRELDAVQAAFGVETSAGGTLVVANMIQHGAAGLTGYSDRTVVHPMCRPEHYEQIAALLEHKAEPYDRLPKISEIHAQTMHFKALTMALLRQRGRVDDLGVERISLGRNLLSPRWRSRLETWWGAAVVSTYGFSEMRVCNANECLDCGFYHMPPTCLAEVLDESRDWEPVQPGGRGLLAVTGFYPFVELEPRVRYVPGDIVQLSPDVCPRWGETGFLPLGRRRHSARATGDGRWICPVDVFAAVDDHADVYRVLPASAAITDHAYDEAASPRFVLESGNPVRLHVELRTAPSVWDTEASNSRAFIESRIPPGVEVVLHDPGSLGDVYTY